MSMLFGFYFPQGFSNTSGSYVNDAERYWKSLSGPCKNSYRSKHFNLFQVDYFQYKQPAWINNRTCVASLVGHPLLTSDRFADLNYLSAEEGISPKRLRQAEGAYGLVHYDFNSKALKLVTDQLGLRPFYYMLIEGGIIFSSCLETFKNLSIPLTSNEEGLCEFATLGYYLLDHSPYREVKCFRPSQLLEFSQTGITKLIKYFDWPSLDQHYEDTRHAIPLIDKDFKRACRKYVGNDTNVLTTLSGGLDSRLIACELKRLGKQITAFNFSQSDTQDLYCARTFAKHNGITLKEVRVDDTQENSVEQRLGLYWQKSKPKEYGTVCRPQLAWSGNGGSVGIGYVFCGEPLYQTALSQNIESLADAYMEQQFAYLPRSVFSKAEVNQAQLRNNIIKSIEEFSELPLEKAYYLFLLHNDQHHHLAIPYEDINSYQMEFCLPMYSWKVLRHVLSLPVEETRRHKFYLSWLNQCYPEALSQPWQAYPGHIQCHHKVKGKKQWQITRKSRFTAQQILKVWKDSLMQGDNRVIDKTKLTLLCFLHVLGVKDATSQAKLVLKLQKLYT